MFTTHLRKDDLHYRPMVTQNNTMSDGKLWFFVWVMGETAQELAPQPQVTIIDADPGKNICVSVSGSAQAVDDKTRRQAMCTKFAPAWFAGGVDDPARPGLGPRDCDPSALPEREREQTDPLVCEVEGCVQRRKACAGRVGRGSAGQRFQNGMTATVWHPARTASGHRNNRCKWLEWIGLIAFGRRFLAKPDLAARLRKDAPTECPGHGHLRCARRQVLHRPSRLGGLTHELQ